MLKSSLCTLSLFALSAGPAGAEWVCVAQDRSFSYEGRSSSRQLAGQNALAACRLKNLNERACYLKRCEEVKGGNAPGAGLPGSSR